MANFRNFVSDLWMDTKKRTILLFVCGLIFLSFILLAVLLLLPEGEEKKPDFPKTEEAFLPVTEPEIKETLPEPEKTEEEKPLSKTVLAKGIDVSKWQGKIDWAKVKEAGIEFAMIRLGYNENGACMEDENAAWNLKEAEKNGILTGVYFYSGAKNPAEAEAEADWVLSKISRFAISFPVVFDYEIQSLNPAAKRTDTALSFLNRIDSAGYEAMLYVALKEFEDPSIWQKERILSQYLVWGARYIGSVSASVFYPETKIDLAMWQYSDQGSVDGISGNVDLNFAYFLRPYSAPKIPEQSEVEAPEDYRQTFSNCNKKVTAKNEVNLRKTPSMQAEIAGTLKNGEYLICTGESDMGWSRLERDGEKLYAVTSYLITSTGESTSREESFRDTFESVTAKDEVNLRLAPSTDAEIAGVLKEGEKLIRTGIGDKGWSRLDLNGTPVYAITSYLKIAE